MTKESQGTYDSFVEDMRARLPWKGIEWDAPQWKLPPEVAGHGARKQSVLHFTERGNGASLVDAKKPFAKHFDDFAKACVCYKGVYRPTEFVGYRRLVVALQFLGLAMSRSDSRIIPWALTTEQFLLAERIIALTSLSESYKWTISRSLQDIARIANNSFLQRLPLNYVAKIKPPKFREGISDEAQEKSLARLPSDEVLEALAGLFVSATLPQERLLLSVIALCATAGFRIGEALTIPEKCEVLESGRLGLRYWPEKGGEPVVKWIPRAAEPIVARAVKELRDLCKEARAMAGWLDQHPGQIKINWEDIPDILTATDLGELLGQADRSSPRSWAKSNKVPIVMKGRVPAECRPAGRGLWYRSADVRTALTAQRFQGPHRKTASGQCQLLGDSLIVVFRNQMNVRLSVSRYIVQPLPYSTIRLWLGESSREGSLFDRHGLKAKNGARLRITTHQFRHWLNTLAANGGLSDVELARWMGRRDLKHNVHYVHGVVRRNVALAKRAIQEGTIVGPIAEAYHQLEPVDREGFLDGAARAVFLMPHGGCMHNFESRPCPKHFACLGGCLSYFRVVGDAGQREALKAVLVGLEQSLQNARSGTGKGAANWVAHLERKIAGARQALAVDDGTKVGGDKGLVRVFPAGKDFSQDIP